MADEEFGATNPLRRGWVITQAKLAIKFHPKGDARRGRSLTLAVTMPHGCNLKDQTEQEQLIPAPPEADSREGFPAAD